MRRPLSSLRRRATLDGEVLGRAFAQRLASVRRGTANPFRDAGAVGTEVDTRASQRDAGDAQGTARVDGAGGV